MSVFVYPQHITCSASYYVRIAFQSRYSAWKETSYCSCLHTWTINMKNSLRTRRKVRKTPVIAHLT